MRQLAVLLAIVLACGAACGHKPAGTAARSNCPAGETCSALVSGLDFIGSGPIALSATRRVRFVEQGSTEMTQPFEASVAGSAFEVKESGADYVVLHALEAGQATLNLREPGTKKLLDRVVLRVSEAKTLVLKPKDYIVSGAYGLAPSTFVDLTIGLRDENGGDLSDDGITVAVTGAGVTGAYVAEDAVLTVTTASTLGLASINVTTSAGAVLSGSLPVTTATSALEMFQQTTLSSGRSACFDVKDASGNQVVGVRFGFQTPSAPAWQEWENCAVFADPSITVTVGDKTQVFSF